MNAAGPLSEALERALLHQLGESWEQLNQNHFRGRLRRPVMELSDGDARLGLWDGRRRTLALARSLVLEQPWGVVCEVLKHEMAHQFVEEAQGLTDQTAHGPAFEAICAKLGIDARASGLPAAPGADEPGSVLRRIARLLALAQSPNVHEAEAAMQQARRLMLKHNIDASAAAVRQNYAFRHVGEPSGRRGAHEQILASILASHFFVEVIWVSSYDARLGRVGRVLELAGTPANLDVAAHVHGFLLETSERLWMAHKRAARIAGDRERRRYLLGVMSGFNEKLKQGATDAKREGLIWLGDPALGDYHHRRHPRRTSGGPIQFRPTEAYEHGREAGKGIVLHRPVSPQSSGRGRLLT